MTSTSRPISFRSAATVFCSEPIADAGARFAPEVGNEPVGRDDLTGAQRQSGEQRTLLPARQRDDPVAVPDLQRAEEADLHRRVVTPRTSKANRSDERGVIAA